MVSEKVCMKYASDAATRPEKFGQPGFKCFHRDRRTIKVCRVVCEERPHQFAEAEVQEDRATIGT